VWVNRRIKKTQQRCISFLFAFTNKHSCFDCFGPIRQTGENRLKSERFFVLYLGTVLRVTRHGCRVATIADLRVLIQHTESTITSSKSGLNPFEQSSYSGRNRNARTVMSTTYSSTLNRNAVPRRRSHQPSSTPDQQHVQVGERCHPHHSQKHWLYSTNSSYGNGSGTSSTLTNSSTHSSSTSSSAMTTPSTLNVVTNGSNHIPTSNEKGSILTTVLSRREVRRHGMRRLLWGFRRTISNTITSSEESNQIDDNNGKYHLRPKQQHFTTSDTARTVFYVGLTIVGIVTILLAWNGQLTSHASLNGGMRGSNSTSTTVSSLEQQQQLLQPQETIHPVHVLASKSSYNGKVTELRASILTSNTNGDVTDTQQGLPSQSEWVNQENVVHVIQTRFMQNQPDLLILGQARLRLLTSVTVPSMRYQTVQQFLWIIRTDPQLHISILEPLITAISNIPNAILVASNRNPEGFRDETCMSDITTETLLSGNMDYVMSYYHAAQTHTVLETRCDADDAISIDFVELIQKSATSGLYPLRQDWMVFCADNHMEWQYDNPWANQIEESSNSSSRTNITSNDVEEEEEAPKDRGALLVLRSGHCVTPGLTWAYSVDATRKDIPVSQHQKIQKLVKPCGTRMGLNGTPLQSKCLIKLGGDFPLALRARTPTSAGMEHVFVTNQTENTFPMDQLHNSKARTLQKELWNVLFVLFGVDGDDLYMVRTYVSEHLKEVAQDNFSGQCTKGHSCKHSSKKLLQEFINLGQTNDQLVNQTNEVQ
jgi:Putative rhamnosyl transferase